MRLGIEAGTATLDIAVELGIGGVPIGAQDLAVTGPENAVAALRERGLVVAQIGAFGYNPLHPDGSIVAAQTEILRKAIDLAPETDCRVIVISCGNYQPKAFGAADRRNRGEGALEAYAAALRPLCGAAERKGVQLSVEPYIKGVVFDADSYLELERLVSSPSLRCNLDVSSLYDLGDLIDPRPKCEATCAKLAGHIGMVHVKDVGLVEGFHIHAILVPITEGPTDWRTVLATLKASVSPDTWLILEHVQDRAEAGKSVEFLRRLAAEVGLALS